MSEWKHAAVSMKIKLKSLERFNNLQFLKKTKNVELNMINTAIK